MKKYIIICFVIINIFGCKQDEQSVKENPLNILLTQKVEVTDRIIFKYDKHLNWVEGLDYNEFVNIVFDKVLSGEFTECYHSKNGRPDTIMSMSEIRRRLGMIKDTVFIKNKNTGLKDMVIQETNFNKSEIKEIITWEDWELNENDFKFKKNVNHWAFVREYFRPNDIKKEDGRYVMPFVIESNKNSSKDLLIAEDIVTVFPFWHENLRRVGLDKIKFFEFIIEHIESGEVTIYDPLYFEKKVKKELSFDKLSYLGNQLSTVEDFDQYIYQMAFLEDWYLDDKTFKLFKEVKGIGFCSDEQIDDEWVPKILFCILFE